MQLEVLQIFQVQKHVFPCEYPKYKIWLSISPSLFSTPEPCFFLISHGSEETRFYKFNVKDVMRKMKVSAAIFMQPRRESLKYYIFS